MENASKSEQDTLGYYNKNANKYANRTLAIDMSHYCDIFLNALDNIFHIKNYTILDFCCGPGRDLKYFLDKGHNVDGIDGSQELIKIAEKYTGKKIFHEDARALKPRTEKYHGIWASACLLHFSEEDSIKILNTLATYLKPRGILYTTLKEGDRIEVREDGRTFYYTNLDRMTRILSKVPGLTLIETKQGENISENSVKWVYFELRKKGTNEAGISENST